ncbi:thiamine pyrophosphate-binding protein [Marinomonas communis]|uniref:Acetolactate synthase large subunit n=1 Tax=Marinomonas communis TaxID=28254 RepID=A0A4V3DG11_9GAMM|nr:thiamine pyrophosphate-binding protein [Marinomonas communis]TDR12481.1 acetolactate synthase large subunit [Marinomonas communis]
MTTTNSNVKSMRNGGRVLIDAIRNNGTDRVFCVPGESYLAALDAMYDTPEIEVNVCRNEGGASYMADAYGKLTGRPGVCFVTRGPGATNASCGLHVAYQDSTPMILFIGQVARADFDREAFQEIDYRRMFGQVSKWVAQIEDASRIPEYVNRAYATATSGRPGPVVLVLPEDMLVDETDIKDLPAWKQIETSPSLADIESVKAALETAERPLAIIGGSGWGEEARQTLESIAETWQLPVANSFRCQDYINNEHPNYVGDLGIGISPALTERMKTADLLLVIGSRLGEMTTRGYKTIDIPMPQQRIIHIHASAEELGKVYYPEVAINATPSAFVKAFAEAKPSKAPVWAAETKQARAEFEDWNAPIKVSGDMQMAEIMDWLNSELPEDSVICNGAGNYTTWIHRFYRFHRHRTQLAPTNGAMGYGTPAAVAAKLVHPERTCIAMAGDGCFMMNGQELATAAQYGANVITIVVNNSMFGTIRMHQEREYPTRVVATELENPDFVQLGKAYGCHTELVESTEQFAEAFKRAQSSNKPALIEIRISKEVISPNITLSQLRGTKV